MGIKPSKRAMLGVILACGTLFAGPCGISTLQLQDFVTSAAIRTAVTTVASIVEAAVIQAELAPTSE